MITTFRKPSPKLREALKLLQKHKVATLTNNQTAVRKRGRKNELQVNFNSADALVVRDLAEYVEVGEGVFTLELVETS